MTSRLHIFAALLLLPCIALGSETKYQAQWCNENNGQMEVLLDDGTWADCITETHAIEVDFDHNWAEAIGQSLHYAMKTKKRAGILLITEKPWLIYRLRGVIDNYNLPIDVFIVNKKTK